MTITQFLRIFWAHKWLPLVTMTGCFLGALIVVLIVQPSYQSSSRVILNTLKPDPVTGEVIGSRSARVYISTQTELIKDYGVAGKVVDQLGWLNDPGLMAQYQAANPSIEFRRWLAQRIIDGTSVSQVPSTNILMLSYRTTTPENARLIAEALRTAYLDSVLESRREEANRNATWYEQQAARVKEQLTLADKAKTDFERANGLIMQSDNVDVDTARLRALAGQGAGVSLSSAAPMPTASVAEMQLVQMDAQIAQMSKVLGPNHPQMAEMKTRRATMVQLAEQERASQRAAAAASAGGAAATAAAIDQAVRQQSSRVIAKRDKIQQLNQLQSEVNLRKIQYDRLMARAAEFRQEAGVNDSGMTALGVAVTPRKPTFPNIPLILGGALALGFAMGILVALLRELFGRRVRGIEDMQSAFDVPLLAVVKPTPPRRPVDQRRRPRGKTRWPIAKKAA